jgi:hypothetical protein
LSGCNGNALNPLIVAVGQAIVSDALGIEQVGGIVQSW